WNLLVMRGLSCFGLALSLRSDIFDQPHQKLLIRHFIRYMDLLFTILHIAMTILININFRVFAVTFHIISLKNIFTSVIVYASRKLNVFAGASRLGLAAAFLGLGARCRLSASSIIAPT